MARKRAQRLPTTNPPRPTAQPKAQRRFRFKLRNARWNVQAWAAIATVLAGLASVPALIISLKAYSLADQQREDALKQRAEDRKQREQEKSEATEAERSAFARRVTIQGGSDPDVEKGPSPSERTLKFKWHYRNGNGKPVYFFLAWQGPDKLAKVYRYSLEPCSEGVISRPAKLSPGKVEATRWAPMVSDVELAWALPDIKAGYTLASDTGLLTAPVVIQDWINTQGGLSASGNGGKDTPGPGFDDAKVDSSKQGLAACVA
ncbi:hypothetical protein ACNF49_25110 [Actinomadura sp. ATCC 39365]